MYNDKHIVAIIPARGGSKGLAGKNIRPLLGKPLIAWTIETAKQSKFLDKIIVSTDSDEIASIARLHGADVPFMRPPELANDTATGTAVILHAIEWLKEQGQSYDYVMVLQPTSPLRIAEDIDETIKSVFTHNATAVVSVCKADHHPYWMNVLPEDLNMKDFIRPDIKNKNRQELPEFYQLNGAVYIAHIPDFIAEQSFFGPTTYAYIMPKTRSVDIDDIQDFYVAESMMKER